MLLPSSSYVKFVASYIDDVKVIWVNMELLHKNDLFTWKEKADREVESWLINRYAYSTCQSQSAVIGRVQKSFLAERYGGGGMTYNGGGARCGIDDFFQVKGIGPNPLVGEKSPNEYKHGTLSMEEAIIEALWGEVLNVLLPHGAVRAIAILSTPVQSKKCFFGKLIDSPGALLVRENCIRTGHFMRAPFFDCSGEGIPSDSMRTKLAVNSVMEYLKEIHKSDSCSLNQHLMHIVSRWAKQFAFSKSIRVMHGAVTASNLSLDGRWLDFNTTTMLSKHSNTYISRHMPSFTNEHKAIFQIISELSSSINAYSVSVDGVDTNFIMETYSEQYDFYRRVYFLMVTGIPYHYLSSMIHDAIVNELFELIVDFFLYNSQSESTELYKQYESSKGNSIQDFYNLILGRQKGRTKNERVLKEAFYVVVAEINNRFNVDVWKDINRVVFSAWDYPDAFNFSCLRESIESKAKHGDGFSFVNGFISDRVKIARKMYNCLVSDYGNI